MKYKPSRDIPKFAQEYNTISPSELARIVLKERHKERTAESVSQWFRSHPEIRTKLAELIENRSSKKIPKQVSEVLAKLITNDYGTVEITNLETVGLAKRRLALIETDLQAQICNQANLQVIRRNFKQEVTQRRLHGHKRKKT